MQEMMQCRKLGAISRGFGHEINKNRVVPALLFFLPLRATLQVLAIFGSRKPLWLVSCGVINKEDNVFTAERDLKGLRTKVQHSRFIFVA